MAYDIDTITQNLSYLLYDIAKQEEYQLSSLNDGRGIFFVNEHALVHLFAREALTKKYFVFGTESVTFEREVSVETVSHIDLKFTVDTKINIYMEFKMIAKDTEYKNDIIKLSKISNDETMETDY